MSNKRKKIRIWKVVLLFIPPMLFALPTPVPFVEKVIKFQDPQERSVKDNVLVPVLDTTSKPIGNGVVELFASLPKIKEMPNYICLDNRNEILVDGAVVDSSELLDSREAGAMSVDIVYLEKDDSHEIYTTRGERKCEVLASNYKSFFVFPAAEVRHALPLRAATVLSDEEGARIVAEVIKEGTDTDISKTSVRIGTQWKWGIYFINVLAFFFVWLGLVLLSFEGLRFVRR